jgi:choline kinase
MRIVICAAGNQDRIGFSPNVKPKSLLEISDTDTILSNTLRQVVEAGVTDIILRTGENILVDKYVEGHASLWSLPPLVFNHDKFISSGPGVYVYYFSKDNPTTFIFADLFVPNGQIVSYIAFANNLISRFDACIGVSKVRVGDYSVVVKGDKVTQIGTGLSGDFYTCGIFSVLNPELVHQLHHTDKLTEVFSQVVSLGKGVGFFEIHDAIDVDTPGDILLLKTKLGLHN